MFSIGFLNHSPSRVTYTGTAIPHCSSAMPIQADMQGRCSRKMCSNSLSGAVLPHSLRMPLRQAQTSAQLLHRHSDSRLLSLNKSKTCQHNLCTEKLHRTKWVSATLIRLFLLQIKAKIKSNVCVSYSVVKVQQLCF